MIQNYCKVILCGAVDIFLCWLENTRNNDIERITCKIGKTIGRIMVLSIWIVYIFSLIKK